MSGRLDTYQTLTSELTDSEDGQPKQAAWMRGFRKNVTEGPCWITQRKWWIEFGAKGRMRGWIEKNGIKSHGRRLRLTEKWKHAGGKKEWFALVWWQWEWQWRGMFARLLSSFLAVDFYRLVTDTITFYNTLQDNVREYSLVSLFIHRYYYIT